MLIVRPDLDYEIRQLELFKRMVEKGMFVLLLSHALTTGTGYITRRLRPTYYSPSSRTALAESELKYKDEFKSRSVYVGFLVEESDMSDGLRLVWRQACHHHGPKRLKLAFWTTTAWSLPGNHVKLSRNQFEITLTSIERVSRYTRI